MSPKAYYSDSEIDRGRIVHLYGLTLLTVTGFFLLGVYVDRGLPVATESESPGRTDPVTVGPSISESQPRMKFHESLNDRTNRGGIGGETRTDHLWQEGTGGSGNLSDSQ